jgi:hypothetical protein
MLAQRDENINILLILWLTKEWLLCWLSLKHQNAVSFSHLIIPLYVVAFTHSSYKAHIVQGQCQFV